MSRRFKVQEKTYYDVVDTENGDQVVIRHDKKSAANGDAATLEENPEAKLQHTLPEAAVPE